MLAAQRQIQERQAEMNIRLAPRMPSVIPSSHSSSLSRLTLPLMAAASTPPTPIESRERHFKESLEEKTKKMIELQARIQNQMGSLAQVYPNIIEKQKPVSVMIDKEGRTVDTATGAAVQMPGRIPTLKANLRAQKQKTATSSIEEKKVEEKAENFFIDPRIALKPAVRTRRKNALVFNEKGKYEELARRQRAQERLEFLQREILAKVGENQIVKESKFNFVEKSGPEGVPDIEWWDSVIVSSYDIIIENASGDRLSGISNLVEHPIQMHPKQITEQITLPIYLTKYEQRKLRRQNRAEQLREQQEKVRLGLAQPPEPKVRLSNLMRVLGNEAIQDPSKIEAYVKNQMERRLKAHQNANNARKLTAEQKKAKKRKKLTDLRGEMLQAAVYRVADLSDPAVKFKLEANCKQLFMTGCVVSNVMKCVNAVVVEGSFKQQKKYQRLMLHRIKWDEVSVREDSTDAKQNHCSLAWQGSVQERAFKDFQFKTVPSDGLAREIFRKHHVEHYWNIAIGDVVIEKSMSREPEIANDV
ncbi:hypothetical protein ACOME3_002352 [Neoechinorhynchus agilis]